MTLLECPRSRESGIPYLCYTFPSPTHTNNAEIILKCLSFHFTASSENYQPGHIVFRSGNSESPRTYANKKPQSFILSLERKKRKTQSQRIRKPTFWPARERGPQHQSQACQCTFLTGRKKDPQMSQNSHYAPHPWTLCQAAQAESPVAALAPVTEGSLIKPGSCRRPTLWGGLGGTERASLPPVLSPLPSGDTAPCPPTTQPHR